MGALNAEAASPIYQVSGRNELFFLEEGKWRYIPGMDIIYFFGYNIVIVNCSPPAYASSTWTWDMYGSVLEAVRMAELPIMAWIGWQPEDIQGLMSRYAEDNTICGWYSQDEPLIASASKEWQQ